MQTTKIGLAALAPIVLASTALLGSAAPDLVPVVHERKEVAGLAIVFGAEPEPALTEEIQFLRWRVSSLEDETPFEELSAAEVMISRDGVDLGTFEVRPVRRTPGQYQTRHIFTEAGEYDTVLSFKKGDELEVHAVDFAFNIGDRAEIELPRRATGEE